MHKLLNQEQRIERWNTSIPSIPLENPTLVVIVSDAVNNTPLIGNMIEKRNSFVYNGGLGFDPNHTNYQKKHWTQ